MSDILAKIQRDLKAPKNEYNSHGKYAYRTAEGILRAFKDLAPESCCIVMRDTIKEVAGRPFLIAEVTLYDGSEALKTVSGAALHAIEQKGMTAAQITGACSSFARKYALCGLFAIDDSTDDPDSKDNRDKPEPPKLVSQEEAAILHDLAERAGSDRAAIFKAKKLPGNSWADTPAALFETFRKGMQAKVDQMDMELSATTKGSDQ